MSFNGGFIIAQQSISTDLYMMRFDGVNESIVTPSYSQIDFAHTQPISGSAWIKLTDYSNGNYQIIFDKENGFFTGYRFFVDATGLLNVQLISSIGAYIAIATSVSPFVNGQLHHVAFTYNGNLSATGLKLYVDGALAATTITNNTGLNATLINGATLLIGTFPPIANFIAGDIGIVRIWNTELTAGEVLQDYNGGAMKNLPIKSANLVFGWKGGQDALYGTQWVFPEESGYLTNPTSYSVNMEFADRILIP
jgi:hypothetical protein